MVSVSTLTTRIVESSMCICQPACVDHNADDGNTDGVYCRDADAYCCRLTALTARYHRHPRCGREQTKATTAVPTHQVHGWNSSPARRAVHGWQQCHLIHDRQGDDTRHCRLGSEPYDKLPGVIIEPNTRPMTASPQSFRSQRRMTPKRRRTHRTG
jgi:hypothetical protein